MAVKLDAKEVSQINFARLQEEFSKAEAKISAMNDIAKNCLEPFQGYKSTLSEILSNWDESEELVRDQFNFFRGQLSDICESIFGVESLASPKVPNLDETKTLKSSNFDCGREFIFEIFNKISKGEKFAAVHKSKSNGIRFAKVSVWKSRLLVHSLQPKIEEDFSVNVCYHDLMKSMKTVSSPACFLKVNLKGNIWHQIHFDLKETYFKSSIIDLCTGEIGKAFKGSFVRNRCSIIDAIENVKSLFQFGMDYDLCLLHQYINFCKSQSVRIADGTYLTVLDDDLAFIKARDANFPGVVIGTGISEEIEARPRNAHDASARCRQFGLITDCGLSVHISPAADFPM